MTVPAHIADSTATTAAPLGVHELVDRIATVLRLAAGNGNPHGVSRDQFNRARALATDPVPSAQAVCKRLKRSWTEVVQLALGPVAKRMGQGARRARRAIDRECPDSLLHTALKACTFALGTAPSPQAYDRWADATEARRLRRGLVANPLPHSATILSRLGDWDDALVAAGVMEPRTKGRATGHPKTSRPVAELIDEFIDAVGILPTRKYFEEWCRRKDVPVGGDVRKWRQALAAARECRTRSGKSTPTVVTPAKDAPPLPAQQQIIQRVGPVVQVWTDESILEALRYYGRTYLRPGQRPTQGHFGSCSAGDPKLPSKSTLTRHGKGFQEWCREAGL